MQQLNQGGDGNIQNQMVVQQDILTGLIFDDDNIKEDAKSMKLAIYKHSQLIKTLNEICALIPSEEQKLRLIGLYLCNYKVMKQRDLDHLLSFVDTSKFP